MSDNDNVFDTFDVDAARVECAVNVCVSIPAFLITSQTYQAKVVEVTLL